jgi:hypothetical protein
VHVEREAELVRVEGDRGIDVVDDVADADHDLFPEDAGSTCQGVLRESTAAV